MQQRVNENRLQGMIQFQRNLDNVCLVANSWKLKLNIVKCVMRLGSSADLRLTDNYDIDCVPLKSVIK